MLERFAGWLVGRMLASQAFPKEDAPLVSFGIVQGLRTLIEIILLLCTGLFMNLFWQGVVILLAFMPLRIYAGGYHARTPMQCAVKTWLLFFGILFFKVFQQANQPKILVPATPERIVHHFFEDHRETQKAYHAAYSAHAHPHGRNWRCV